MIDLRKSVEAYCAKIGSDPLLVQGAGGNFSWKENDTLWIKASGMWLADAGTQDIFVPVDLRNLVDSIKEKNFDATPKLLGQSYLRPSIETMLHAIMPQKIVAHLHDIEILSYLVRVDFNEIANKLMKDLDSWFIIKYFKPGSELAEALEKGLSENPGAQIVFLKNHGVVFAADTIEDLEHLVKKLHLVFTTEVNGEGQNSKLQNSVQIPGYEALKDHRLASLVFNEKIFDRLEKDWVLYPDHVVFLGHTVTRFNSVNDFQNNYPGIDIKSEVIFIKNFGIYAKTPFSKAKSEQLICYQNIMMRQNDETQLTSLSAIDISKLLNWDAETYRKEIAK